MMKRTLLFATLSMILSIPCYAACTITYTCTNGTGTPPTQQTGITATGFTAQANTCTRADYVFVGWDITNTSNATRVPKGGFVRAGETYSAGLGGCSSYAVTLTLSPHWITKGDLKLPTSKAYTDTEFDKKLNAIPAMTNKVLTFPTTGTTQQLGTPRSIVSTLGTQTNGNYPTTGTDSDALVTRGAIKGGVDRKQDILSGTPEYAATYTGAVGTVGEKPIYNGLTGSYDQALVQADALNAAIIDAVNSELTEVPAGFRINDSVTTIMTGGIDPGRAIVGDCSMSASGEMSANGEAACDNINMEPGMWAVGVDGGGAKAGGSIEIVYGQSVCSTIVKNEIIPDYEGQEALDYELQEGKLEGNVCFCRMASPMLSYWIGHVEIKETSAKCPRICARACVDNILASMAFRSTIFGTIRGEGKEIKPKKQ